MDGWMDDRRARNRHGLFGTLKGGEKRAAGKTYKSDFRLTRRIDSVEHISNRRFDELNP